MQGADVVVHLAALPRVQFTIDEPIEAQEVNVNGTLSVLEAMRSAGVPRIVFATSAAVYGDQETMPLTESMPAQPKSPYGLHKYMGERMLKLWHELYGIESVSLRFFNVYGPHLDPEGAYALAIGRFLKLRAEGKPITITGDGEQTRDFVHVRDVADAIVRASADSRVGGGEVFNVGTGTDTSINTLAALIGGPLEYIPPRIEPRAARADISHIREALGWQPKVALADGIAELKGIFNIL
jgi:nucleoside-diphosphate-sugar epimerase